MTARDFGTVYSAYLKFQEEMVEALSTQDQGAEELKIDENLEREIEQQITRLQNLVENRAKLLNLCNLRMNPNSVSFWLK